MTTSRPPLPLARALLALLGAAVAALGADAKPEDQAISASGSLADQFDYDSNPHLTTKRYQAANLYTSDYVNDAVARLRLDLPRVPLVLRGRVVDDEYLKQHALDSTVTTGQVELPVQASAAALVAPGYRREDQWYDGHYFQADDRGDLKWTQDWTPTVSTTLDPFYSELTHPTAFRGQDGSEYGVDCLLDLLPSEAPWLSAVTVTFTPERYEATTRHFGYHQLDSGIDLAFDLPAAIRLLVDTDVIATTYNTLEPGRQVIRHDRTVTCDVSVSRDLISHLSAEGICEMTRTKSNLKAFSFDEVIAGIGLKWTMP